MEKFKQFKIPKSSKISLEILATTRNTDVKYCIGTNFREILCCSLIKCLIKSGILLLYAVDHIFSSSDMNKDITFLSLPIKNMFLALEVFLERLCTFSNNIFIFKTFLYIISNDQDMWVLWKA